MASAAGEDVARQSYVRAVRLEGQFERLPYGLARGVAVDASGPSPCQPPGSRDPAAWKRYRGGTASKLWLSPSGDGEWQPVLPEVTAGMVSPFWFAGRQRRLLKPTENLGAVRPNHGGDGSLVEWRGNAFYLSHRDGTARALAADRPVRVRGSRVRDDTSGLAPR